MKQNKFVNLLEIFSIDDHLFYLSINIKNQIYYK